MMQWLEAIALGVVQGITEFLPVSSDGHLLMTQNIFDWLTGRKSSGEENLFFDVILPPRHDGGHHRVLSPRGARRPFGV